MESPLDKPLTWRHGQADLSLKHVGCVVEAVLLLEWEQICMHIGEAICHVLSTLLSLHIAPSLSTIVSFFLNSYEIMDGTASGCFFPL